MGLGFLADRVIDEACSERIQGDVRTSLGVWGCARDAYNRDAYKGLVRLEMSFGFTVWQFLVEMVEPMNTEIVLNYNCLFVYNSALKNNALLLKASVAYADAVI